MNFGSDECTEIYHWCEASLFLSQAVLKYAASKDFIFNKSVQGTGSDKGPDMHL